MIPPAMDDREALRNFIDAMKIAEAAARQMAFYTQRPDWLKVHLALGNVRETAVTMALSSRRILRAS